MTQCHFTELFKLCYQQNMLKVRMSNHRYVEQLKRTSEESEITIKYLVSANTGWFSSSFAVLTKCDC